jgi:hypothetical protein
MSSNARRTTPRLIRDTNDTPSNLQANRQTLARGDDLTCPKCERAFARRSHRKGIFEFLCSFVLIYPYRCQLCAHRFLATPKMSARAPHREFERLRVEFPVSFQSAYLDRNISGEGTLTNLSIRGCSLIAQHPMGKGTFLRLRFRYSETDAPIEVDVAAVRMPGRNQIGLEFLNMQPKEEERLRRLLEHLLYGRFH